MSDIVFIRSGAEQDPVGIGDCESTLHTCFVCATVVRMNGRGAGTLLVGHDGREVFVCAPCLPLPPGPHAS